MSPSLKRIPETLHRIVFARVDGALTGTVLGNTYFQHHLSCAVQGLVNPSTRLWPLSHQHHVSVLELMNIFTNARNHL